MMDIKVEYGSEIVGSLPLNMDINTIIVNITSSM
jgi:hypothetical protein